MGKGAEPTRHSSKSGSIEPLTASLAQCAGEILAETGGSNAVDATVVASASQRGDLVVTGDPVDLRRLAASLPNVTIAGL